MQCEFPQTSRYEDKIWMTFHIFLHLCCKTMLSNFTRERVLFFLNISMIVNVILILCKSSTNKKLKLSYIDTILSVFALFHKDIVISNRLQTNPQKSSHTSLRNSHKAVFCLNLYFLTNWVSQRWFKDPLLNTVTCFVPDSVVVLNESAELIIQWLIH